jgi:hypothetical protein
MAQKHVQTILLLLACIAYAQVPDFNIYRDGDSTPLIESPPGTVDTTIYYGSSCIFSVKMKDGSEGYGWCWREGNSSCTPGQSRAVSAPDNVSSTLRITVIATKGSESREKTIILKVIPTYTVKFNSSGGNNNPGTQTIWGDRKVTKPDDPEQKGYIFEYWYVEGKSSDLRFNFESSITENITLVAKWKALTYTITYFLNRNDEIPWSIEYFSPEDPAVILPKREDGCTRKFEGWLNPKWSTPISNFIPRPEYYEDMTFYVEWGEEKKRIPTEASINYESPAQNGYEYGPEVPLEWNDRQKQDKDGCEIGNITIWYTDMDNNSTEQPPKDVGEYKISVHFEGNENYEAAVVPLPETIKINKFNNFRTPPTYTYIIKDKEYDGTNKAEVKDLEFPGVPLICNIKETDYTINATFTRIDVNPDIPIPVDVTLTWEKDGPAYKNCNLDRVTDGTTNKAANITKATNVKFEIIVPEYYRLSSPGAFRPRIITEPFVDERGVVFEYRKEGESEFTDDLLSAAGQDQRWEIKATLAGTRNYEPAEAFGTFRVVRGSDMPIEHGFTIEGFKEESKFYFSENCKIDSEIVQATTIQIEILESDVYFKRYNGFTFETPNSDCDINPYCEGECTGEKCYKHYNIPITFNKQGLDTLIYSLSCRDGSCNDIDTLLIETALPFESLVQQRWNNTLFVNNNHKTNGGYSFSDFTWIQNDKDTVSLLQSYSAGDKSTDLLKPSDTYRVQMHYLQDNNILKISTCEGHSKFISATAGSEAAFKKQVLGIGGKKASDNAKVYNSKGSVTSGNAPGVYLVEEK